MLGAQRSHQPFNGAASATDHTLLAKQQLQATSGQRRLFLSPQPHQTSSVSSNVSPYFNNFLPGRHSTGIHSQHQQQPFGGSSGNILDGVSNRMMSMRSPPIEENSTDMPYYAELTSPNHPVSSSSSALNNQKPPPPSANPGFLPAPFPLAEHLRSKSIQHSQHLMELRNRVQRVEWKSADSLQQQTGGSNNYYSPLVSTNTIEFGDGNGSNADLLRPSWNNPGNVVPGMSGLTGSKSTGKLISSSGHFESKSNLPLSLPKTVELPQKSPEYDQIKSPSEIAKERLEAMLAAKIGKSSVNGVSRASATTLLDEMSNGHSEKVTSDVGGCIGLMNDQVKVLDSVAATAAVATECENVSFPAKSQGGSINNNVENDQNDENDKILSGSNVSGLTQKNNKLDSTTSVLPSSVLSNNNLNTSNSNCDNTTPSSILSVPQKSGGGGAESTDCSSLGRSSTSDGDFGGTLGGRGADVGGGGSACSGNFNMYTAHAGKKKLICTN